MSLRLSLLLTTICATAALDSTCWATRIALVSGQSGAEIENALDMATALLSKEANLQLLDRAEVDRVLREQQFSRAGLLGAEQAIKVGQLLHADLFAVLEGPQGNGSVAIPAFGLVVFDARTGVRYADSALAASNAVSAASATAVAVRAAMVKSRRNPQELHTVGLLSVRNADLPRGFDSICDTVGLLLERELTALPRIAVLERRRLEQVNKERSLAPDAEGNRLLGSLCTMQLDIGRDGDGLRATLMLARADILRTNAITATVPSRNPADLAHLLVEKTERLLMLAPEGASAAREAEAARFHREYLLLLQHRDYFPAVRALEAALALDAGQAGWQCEMTLLLFDTAIEVLDPGGQTHQGLKPYLEQPTSDKVADSLVWGQRGADLLLDLSKDAAGQAQAVGPTPLVLKEDYRGHFIMLLAKLLEINRTDPALAAGISSLTDKERTLRMEVLEPFLAKQSVNRASFARYSDRIWLWINFEGFRYEARFTEACQDDMVILRRWVELSHKLNPADGSGDYRPLEVFPGSNASQRGQSREFRQMLEQDSDPVIRLHGHAGWVAATMQRGGYQSATTLAAERQFRLYAQELLAHGDAAKPGPLREQVWRAITDTLGLLINENKAGQEYLDACLFACEQGDIRPFLFYHAFDFFEAPLHRDLSQELKVVNPTLKLILERPAAYPAPLYQDQYGRNAVIADLEKRRDRLTAELAGSNASNPDGLPWKRKTCLLDLSTPLNGLAWLYKPVVEGGQVYVTALGFREWGMAEDSVQLVRVPLAGGPPALLGRASISGIEWINRPYVLKREVHTRLKDADTWLDVGRAACVGAGCYVAGTCSGVYIFPTNGEAVVHLGAENGLPVEDVHAVAYLDSKLYIGAGGMSGSAGYFAGYDLTTHKLTVIASSRRSEHLSPLDDQSPFCTLCIVPDSGRHRLLMAVSSAIIASNKPPAITPSMGIWSYEPRAGEFKRLAPLRLPTGPPVFIHCATWAGWVDANTIVVKDPFRHALFDASSDRLLPPYESNGAKPHGKGAIWQTPIPQIPGRFKLPEGPFALHDGWFYSARPLERVALADGRREAFQPPRTDYPFEPKECLQFLANGKQILAADQYSVWLLELGTEAARASVDSGGSTSLSAGR